MTIVDLIVIATILVSHLPAVVGTPGQSDGAYTEPFKRQLPTIRPGSPQSPWNTCEKSGGPYKLQDYYRGESFLNDWEFFSWADPTNGNVNYQTRANAIAKNLAYVKQDGTTVLAVDDFSNVPVGGRRDSVRINTKKRYNEGLFIADFWKMPYGCSLWPAYWSVGPNWPNGGEIDVLEGANLQKTNQYTLHTGPMCTASLGNVKVDARLIHTQCASYWWDNRGCGFSDSDERSYGKGFNDVGGGVFAHLWNRDGIKMWHFARSEIPADLKEERPNPATWVTPVAFWSSRTCDMGKNFYEHTLVIDTTICGDWAGATYSSSGCPGTCAEAVANKQNFKGAKWEINYIAVYQRNE
ncbi:glycoside hydrolase family 16 protein [Coprinopsis marcescibilis]|uniref:Glycoside hydrolase family 16 protein n=1 Tax=Coprinopsis marcescibilis TaxID=230819 RepID=A0A5C3LA82_COPMA|nr:glycoside hydrolase family 16 protein [Coprinopsis marcescibilis]